MAIEQGSRKRAFLRRRGTGGRVRPAWRLTVVSAASLVAATAGIAIIPTAASADLCTITVTVAGGAQLNFQLNLPPGTPLSSLSLPVKLPVANVSESCAPTTTTAAPTVSVGASGSASTPTSTKTGTTTTQVKTTVSKVPAISKPHAQRASQSAGANGTGALNPKKPGTPQVSGGTSPAKPVTLTGAGGAPSVLNPTYSFALPGPAPIGVPNFFIDNFEIPPFLLPIYQAAGIEYDIPWQILASINQIETDYGRNLSISSANAVGWMQFLPSTWKQWGVDANGDGIADPYNPVDAIFTAARYLHAAGATHNIPKAVFAYNHANWYVQSVLLRARLIGGIPSQLLGALNGLVQGHFPVAASATYADDTVDKAATRRIHAANVAVPVTSDTATGTNIYAKQGSPVIAVNDGKVIRIGQSKKLGKFVVLQDQTGNAYTYSNLGSIPRLYAIPKITPPSAASLAKLLSLPGAAGGVITSAASAGSQLTNAAKTLAKPATKLAGTLASSATSSVAKLTKSTPAAAVVTSIGNVVKQRLFAHPETPQAYAAGGAEQVSAEFAVTQFRNYFSDVLHLSKSQYTLAPLVKGSIVVAGTILGRVGPDTATKASHLYFQIQPAGKDAPLVDPKPILDGWKLLEATAVYRAKGVDPFFGPGAKNPSTGEVLLMSKEQLQQRIVKDPHVTLDPCTIRQIESGSADRRILAALEFLSVSGLDPTAEEPSCLTQVAGPNQAAATADGSTVDITKINNIPVLGHQGNGSIADLAIRRLLTLQGSLAPSQIISLMTYKGQSATLALPDHSNRIQIAFTPLYGQNKALTAQLTNLLKPKQWIDLISRISQIPEPTIPTKPSPFAIRTAG